MNTPTRKEVHFTRYEWVIGVEEHPTSARDLQAGIICAQQDMESMGLSLDSDDCYWVRAGEGGEIIIFREVQI
jgi:hypothetical protein